MGINLIIVQMFPVLSCAGQNATQTTSVNKCNLNIDSQTFPFNLNEKEMRAVLNSVY